MTKDINEWVKQRLGAGENSSELKERLSTYGHDPTIVDQIISSSPQSPENKREDVKKIKPNKFLIIGLIIIIITCISAFYFTNGISRGDILDLSRCNKIKISGLKNECYKSLAISRGDLSICDKIGNQDTVDWCYRDIATNKSDVAICDKIKSNSLKNHCYTDISVSRDDISICDKIITDNDKHYLQDDKYYCRALVKMDISICENMQYKSRCYEDIAIRKGDTSICNKILYSEFKDRCYGNVARVRGDSSICDKIPTQSIKDECYDNVAMVTKDSSICDKIQAQHLKDRCYKEINKSEINNIEQGLSNCDEFHPDLRDECYNYVAIVTGEPSICDKIQNKTVKDECREVTN